jgi:TetR/AcrR family transcriptional repressor of nem operon
MKGAGLTVGGFYAHFASKEELIDEVLGRAATGMRERLFARIDEKPAADRAEVVLTRYLSPAHRDNTEGGCPLPAVVGEVGTTAAEHRDVLGTQIDAMASELATHLPAPESGTPKRYVALGLVALMYGGLSISRALRGTELADDMLKACRALGRIAARNGSRFHDRPDRARALGLRDGSGPSARQSHGHAPRRHRVRSRRRRDGDGDGDVARRR